MGKRSGAASARCTPPSPRTARRPTLRARLACRGTAVASRHRLPRPVTDWLMDKGVSQVRCTNALGPRCVGAPGCVRRGRTGPDPLQDSSRRAISSEVAWGRLARCRRPSPTRVAVGTALAGGPPRRSQRAELPHWAPGSGQTAHGPTPRRDVINAPAPPAPLRRTRSGTWDTPDLTRLCVRGVSCRPGSPRLAPSLHHLRSHRLVRRLRRYYEAIRLPTLVHPRRAATAFPGRPDPDQRAGQAWDLPVLADRDSLHAKVL